MKRRSLYIALGGALSLSATNAEAGIEVEGENYEVVDLHLHSGTFGQLAPSGKSFLVAGTPDFTQLYAPAIFDRLLDPYAPHVGIQAQTQHAGIDHALVLAAYTHHTTGYMTNRQLVDIIESPDNVSADADAPWAWGLASINFFDGFELDSAQRLSALASYLEAYPERVIGIKLAHAHQSVPLDAEEFLGVYDVAAAYGVPVLLHTGFSPFPNSETEPEYYDPYYLESVVANYEGDGPLGRVDFVLAHVGGGDARATQSALRLAELYDNVHLEISALNRPLQIDIEGQAVQGSEPQYLSVLAEIKARDLVSKCLFATDGAQFSGFVASYLALMVEGMQAAGYSSAQMASVLAGNFHALYGV